MSNILKYKTSDDSKIMYNDWFDEQTTGEQYQEDGWWCAVLNEGVDFMDGAFSYTNVTDVIIPNGITDISYAFNECTGLTNVTIPESLTTIGDEAFNGGAFTYAKLPENAVSIGWHAFADCPNLAYIYIPALTTQIDEEAFGNLEDLTIIGKVDSTAESYAQNHHYNFIAVP
jgi:hypothetical protein